MGFKLSKEQDLVTQCLGYLRLRRILAWRVNNTGVHRTDAAGRSYWVFHGTRGVADILGVLGPPWPGRFLAVETKRHPRKPTAAQAAFLRAVNDAGGLGVVVYDLTDLRAAIGD